MSQKRQRPDDQIGHLTPAAIRQSLATSSATFNLVLDHPCPRHDAATGVSCFPTIEASTGRILRSVCPTRIRKDVH